MRKRRRTRKTRSARAKYKKFRRNSGRKYPPGRPPGVPWTRPKSNPAGGIAEVGITIGAGFAGFAGTRIVSRVVGAMVGRRWPRAAKHVSAAVSVGLTALSWMFAHRSKYTRDYAEPITLGAGVSAVQTIAQTYLPPRFGWLIGHDLEIPQLPAGQNPGEVNLPDEPQATAGDDPASSYAYYNEATDAGRYASPQHDIPVEHVPEQESGGAPASDDDILAGLGHDDDDLGSFGSSFGN